MKEIKSSEITPEHIYMSRRELLKKMGFVGASAALLAACKPSISDMVNSAEVLKPTGIAEESTPSAAAIMDELGASANSYKDITNYNNFYEFTTDKEGVARLAENYPTSPWQVQVGGLVNNPKTYSIDDLRKFETEERIYRMRCVEAWSMVIPWMGFPLSKLLNEVEPKPEAKYVRFETIHDPDNMPGFRNYPFYQWPYIEGLQIDEAMHDLTILATGLYGKDLLPQNGAPVRLAVPWKYGFKSIKSIVKIDLVEEMPVSLWMAAAPQEYGFYANVNPNVSHPRWSQATERRIGEFGRMDTLMFNGYEEEVSHLYSDIDLTKYY
ncbi:MAG: protein-methionine-sulfoxide reductase catalytic subunit MsrP [Anaerolineaceae bacterium]|nr:protein-methionine-sulfoxide reductase catalytic subunit MsrP [Anaerolineaceae bacterium]